MPKIILQLVIKDPESTQKLQFSRIAWLLGFRTRVSYVLVDTMGRKNLESRQQGGCTSTINLNEKAK